MRIFPNTVTGSTSVSQDYTQVGQLMFRVRWERTPGAPCNGGNPCTGTFLGETIDDQYGNTVQNVQHMSYMSDPLASTPLVGGGAHGG